MTLTQTSIVTVMIALIAWAGNSIATVSSQLNGNIAEDAATKATVSLMSTQLTQIQATQNQILLAIKKL